MDTLKVGDTAHVLYSGKVIDTVHILDISPDESMHIISIHVFPGRKANFVFIDGWRMLFKDPLGEGYCYNSKIAYEFQPT